MRPTALGNAYPISSLRLRPLFPTPRNPRSGVSSESCVTELSDQVGFHANLWGGAAYLVDDDALALYLPYERTKGLPGAITLTRPGLRVTQGNPDWQPCPLLGSVLCQLAVPPGVYQVTVDTADGPVHAAVTVGDVGGAATLAWPG